MAFDKTHEIAPWNWELPPTLRRRLGGEAGGQQVVEEDGNIVLLLHQLPTPGDPTREPQLWWLRPDGEWLSTVRGNAVAMLRQHVESYRGAAVKLDASLDAAVNATEYFEVLAAAGPVHRACRNMYDVLKRAADMTGHDALLIDVRDHAHDVDRALELVEQGAKYGLDYKIAHQSEEVTRLGLEHSEAAHKLNVVAAIFLPLTAVASVFGMNLHHGFERMPPVVFWLVFVLGVLSGFLVRVALVRRPRRQEASGTE